MTINSIPSRTRTLPFLMVVLMAAGACADAVSDPMAQETRAALDFGGAVPSLADVWVESGGILDEVPVTRWEDSWELPAREGRALRALVYDDEVPALFGRFREGALAKLLVDMDSTLARVDQLSAIGIPELLSLRLDSAREMLTRAWILAEEREGASSLTAALQASDYLLEVTPPHVAAQLLVSAEGGVRGISADDSYSEQMQGRAERLIDVAREAIHNGDYARVIRGS